MMRYVVIAAVLCVPVLAALHAFGPAEQSLLDAELAEANYYVAPVVTAVPSPTGAPRDTAPSSGVVVTLAAPAVTSPAVRGTMAQVAETVPPVGILGLPLAPADLEGCDLAKFYRIQFGLPEHFDGVAWRESRCLPDASNSCCSGLWQIHRLWVSHLAECEVYARADLYDAQRNACAAAHIYAVQGADAWQAW